MLFLEQLTKDQRITSKDKEPRSLLPKNTGQRSRAMPILSRLGSGPGTIQRMLFHEQLTKDQKQPQKTKSLVFVTKEHRTKIPRNAHPLD